jgi:hypothetical protein
VNRTLVLVVVCAACSKASGPEMTWVDLAPLPVEVRLPKGAHAAPLEALVEGKQPTMMASARACVITVAPSAPMDVAAFQASIQARRPGAAFTRVRAPETGDAVILASYAYGEPKRSTFALLATIGDAAWLCEPFTTRDDLSCEEAACRSLRAKR